MNSRGSVSVAAQPSLASATTVKVAGSRPPIPSKSVNKMKLDMPPRPAKGSSRQPQAESTKTKVGKEDAASVPHVVRVTFLGVAGLLAKPSSVNEKAAQNDADEGSSSPPIPPSACPASADHPSLLLPLPPNMRVVASVSRSRTARGIPSGMSRPLSSTAKPPENITATKPSDDRTTTGESIGDQLVSTVSGESIIVGKQSATLLKAREGSLYDDRHQKVSASHSSSSSLPPPSQLSHKRTTSSHRSGLQSAGSGNAKGYKPPTTPTEGIEVIRPLSPREEGPEEGKSSKEMEDEEVVVPPERLVAMWDEGKRPAPKPTGDRQSQQPRFVNQSSSLAFEADLRPSTPAPPATEEDGRASTPVASTAFAPKSFCVTLGLVPDFDEEQHLDDAGEAKEQSGPALPTFAIPVGFADLVINGEETLDGKRKQVDLPLSSLSSFLGLEASSRGGYPFPLIELMAEGLAAANNTAKETDGAKIASTAGKGKKKIFKKMFSGRRQQASAATADNSEAKALPTDVYDGPTPKSIFDLGRPPNAKERALFLERYGVDPSGDAVVRIGLEVFQRGSELENIFRQKNKLRRKKAAAAANRSTSKSDVSVGSTAGSRSLMDDEFGSDDDSVYSQSFFTFNSHSGTTWDESTMYTDALSSFNTNGDDMSYTTDFTNYDKARASPQSVASKSPSAFLANMLSCQGPTNLNCGRGLNDVVKSPDAKEENPYSNIDTVASAVASMKMPGPDERDAASPSSEADGIRSDASTDTAEMGNNRPVSPEIMKEGGEELTLDTAVSFKDRAVIIEKEETPLATIQQRFSASKDLDDVLGESVGEEGEEAGKEVTLEEDSIYLSM